MGVSEQMGDQSSDEPVRKLVVPTSDVDLPQDDPDGDRSPTDEDTKRDAPVEPVPDDGDDGETLRKPVFPDAE